VLGYRFLSSGLSNWRRWPHATETAAIISEKWATPFGAVATALMVIGGAGLLLGVATPLSGVFLAIFLVPTFVVHRRQHELLAQRARQVEGAISDDEARQGFRMFERHAIHSHETGVLENLVYLAAAVFFATRGSSWLSIDALIRSF
jgi:uncharacterized membrane protein YphA (DoxX/SURF4 family)